MAEKTRSARGQRKRSRRAKASDSPASSKGGRPARARAAARSAGKKAANAARNAATRARSAAEARRAERVPMTPHLALVRAPTMPMTTGVMDREIRVATYNVHRWTGLNGRRAPDPARAGFVISELEADVIALQEVLRPAGEGDAVDDPLLDLAEALGLHLVFAVTREHRRGQLGNAILSRFPVAATSVLDISHSRLERRGALAAQFNSEAGQFGVVATHLSLVDRTRDRQVRSLLEHPQLNSGPAVLLGDMNAWRKCKATRNLDDSLHNNHEWPATFPAAKPVLALDRVYALRAKVLEVRAHDTPAARRASDHLPIIATIGLLPDAKGPTTSRVPGKV